MPLLVEPRAGQSSISALHDSLSVQDVYEDKEKSLVTATFELPGFNKENIVVRNVNNALAVFGELKFEFGLNENEYLLREGRLDSPSLPLSPRYEEIKACIEHGVVTVTYASAAAEQTPKKITVS